MTAYKAATLSDAEVKTLSDDACKQMDSENKKAGASSKYTKRLNKIAKALGNNINGTPVNYKVYMTSDVNAWAMANGCVRVYSGLMDMMTDNEVEAVLGHELGHVALGHSRKAMQTAYATIAARDAISATSGAAASARSISVTVSRKIKSKTALSSGLILHQPAIIAQFFRIRFPLIRNLKAILTFRRRDAYNARRLYIYAPC